MTHGHHLLAALALDQVVGDPRWIPHPVRLIGRLASSLEAPTRRVLPARVAGAATVILVLVTTAGLTHAVVRGAAAIHPRAGDVVRIVVLCTTLAARDLSRHASRVHEALTASDLDEARRRVAFLVGRDTKDLDEPEIVRATVESVAENTVDGVTAPLFFGALLGPVGAMVYKAINTLDSTFGYKNEQYLEFGWASARLDDLANYVPSRLTAPVIALAATLLGLRGRDALRIWIRDRRKHPSPNSGMAEAAVAGALGVELGGMNSYGGKPSLKPTLGDRREPLARAHIQKATTLMLATTVLTAGLFLGFRNAARRFGGGA